MTKKKNKKLQDLWNKLKKPLMILSIVGNILFLIFIIVGCVGTHKKATQSNAQGESTIFTLRNTEWQLNESVDMTPKGYVVDTLNPFPTENYMLSFSDIDTAYLGLRFEQYRGLFQISYFKANQYGGYDVILVYSSLLGWFDTDYMNISIANLYDPNKDYDNTILMQWFLDNATLLNGDFNTFVFADQINYNAPYYFDLSSQFITHVFDSGVYGFELVYTFPLFESNGQLFDTIRLWYWQGNGTKFLNEGNTISTNSDLNSAYYGFMEYKNSVSDLVVEVNSRTYIMSDNTYIVRSSTWNAIEYKTLKFQNPLDSTQRKNLSQFNNSQFVNGFSATSGNVGLGSVFSLMGNAFTSLTSLLAIEILPNITIGLLIFIPLIVMIILAVIWIVKR